LSRSVIDLELTALFDRSVYVSGIAIVITLLYFTIYFPYKSQTLNLFLKILVWIPGIILSGLVYSNFFIVEFVTKYSEYEFVTIYNIIGYWSYSIYFVFVALLSLGYLFKKYKQSEQIFKKKIKLLLITIIIGLIFGSYFNLFLLYFGDFRFIWLGPVFSVFMNAVVFYLIFSARDKINAKT